MGTTAYAPGYTPEAAAYEEATKEQVVVYVATIDEVLGYQLMTAGRTAEEAREAMRKTWERVRDHADRIGHPLENRTFGEAADYHGMWILEVPLGAIGIYGDSSAERLVV